MGSSNSRMGSGPSRRTQVKSSNSRFASFFCATSLPHDDAEMEDNLAEALVRSVGHDGSSVEDSLCHSVKEYPPSFSLENEGSSSSSGNGASGESNGISLRENSTQYGSENRETTDAGKGLSESKELVPCEENTSYSTDEAYCAGSSHLSSTTKELQPPESAPVNKDARLASVSQVDDATGACISPICTEQLCPSIMPQRDLEQMHDNGPSSAENHLEEVVGVDNSSPNSVTAVSDSSATWRSLGDESVRDAAPPGLGFLLPTIQRDQINGSVLHVDVVSISSSIFPSSTGQVSGHEARRNSRRLFWDAFSRRSSRRLTDSPTIVFSTEDTDDMGSADRWLLDFSGELFDNGVRDNSGFFSRRHGTHERRRQSRSEIWDRLRHDLDETSGHTAYCASGIHPDGTCSCEALLMAEESGTRASISRIVMLAEALFEVLDEIHRQPVSLSFSMLSMPAPEFVVDSFPLKSHKMPTVAENGDDVEQCYICLAEYEEGDKIRVLPCCHEYHMSCVDKWLKEIHGVCPVCRRDVCGGAAESSVSNA